jgi:type VI secretion system protein ImpK
MSNIAGDVQGAFLLERFWAFHSEVVALKRKVAGAGWGVAAPEPEEGEQGRRESGLGPAGSAHAVSQHLQDVLRRDAADAARIGGTYGARLFQEAQYVMAALADEVFLHQLDWPGRRAWTGVLLEDRLFGSHRAGEQVFRNIDELLDGRSAAHAELAVLYLLALRLGFRGRHRGEADEAAIDRYKERLFRFVTNRAPRLAEPTERFFPEGYRRRLAEGPPRYLPHLRRWVGIAAAVVLLYLAVTHLLWLDLAADLTAAMHGRI